MSDHPYITKSDRYSYEVYMDAKKEWRWRVRSRNGRILFASSEGYKRKRTAKRGFNAVCEFAMKHYLARVYYVAKA